MTTRHLPTWIALIVLGPMALFISLDLPYALPCAVFVTTVTLWFTELIPLPVTGIMVPVLITLFGVSPAKEAFQSFGNEILFLFIGCFLLAVAMQKHGWDKRMAYYILSKKSVSRTPDRLIAVITLLCWTLSMWISNTAACAMMTPICLGIISIYEKEFPSRSAGKGGCTHIGTRLLLVCAFASSIGGLATPIGTPPNLIALQFLREMGVEIGFFQWMKIGLPISSAMLVFLLVLTKYRYPVQVDQKVSVHSHFYSRLKELGPINRGELQIAGVFGFAVLLWVLPGLLNSLFGETFLGEYFSQYCSMSVVGVTAGIILFVLPTSRQVTSEMNLSWEDAKGIDWGTILLFGGGLTLGKMLSDTGLAQHLGASLFPAEMSILMLTLVAVAAGILMSEFASNTASASIMIPILIATLSQMGLETKTITSVVIGCTFGASYGFMLPVSTPPNAIVYGTGKLPACEMRKSGVFFDIGGFLVIVAGTLFLIPYLL